MIIPGPNKPSDFQVRVLARRERSLCCVWLSRARRHNRFVYPPPPPPPPCQPFLEILCDELLMLYWYGAPVSIPAVPGPGPSTNQTEVPAVCRAMLISFLGDYPAQTATANTASQPAINGACYCCTVPGLRGPGNTTTIYPSATTNANLFGRAASEPAPPPPPPYATKDNDYFLNAARAADHSAYNRAHASHPARLNGTGIYGSHAFQELPYWRECFRSPDSAHGISNDLKSIVDMFTGASALVHAPALMIFFM
jgi:hypothetical protein